MKKYNLGIAAILLLCLSAAGCFEVEERVSIAESGAAAVNIKVRLPLLDKTTSGAGGPHSPVKLLKIENNVAGVAMTPPRTETKYGQTITQFGFSSDSFQRIAQAYANFPKEGGDQSGGMEEGMKGMGTAFSEKGFYTIRRKGKGAMIIRRLISESPTKSKPEAKKKKKGKDDTPFGGEFGKEMVTAMMGGGMKFRFDLTVPGTVLSSNAESIDGNTMHWVIPIDYLQKNKVVLEAVVKADSQVIDRLVK